MNLTENRRTIQGAKSWLEHNLQEAYTVHNESYSKLLILATIDCFAQMWGNYPPNRENKNNYCNFVMNYSSQSTALSSVCPVTLHYHYLKDNSLELKAGRLYEWEDPDLCKEADRILFAISDEKQRNKARKEHSYITLLYQLRNKLVHELDNLGTKIEFSKDVPSVASGIFESGERIWTLNYPRLWLYNLAQETINNFLDECLRAEELLSFLDNERTTDLTWYV